MTVKTDVSRFHIHDELTAPDGSAPLLKSIQTAGGAVSKFVGVLAGVPRGAARLHPHALRAPRRRAAAGDARADRPRGRRAPRRPLHARPARPHRARRRARPRRDLRAPAASPPRDPKEAALLAFLEATARRRRAAAPPPASRRRARPAGPTSSSSRRSPHVALNEFQSLIANAAALPQDQADAAVLPAAA